MYTYTCENRKPLQVLKVNHAHASTLLTHVVLLNLNLNCIVQCTGPESTEFSTMLMKNATHPDVNVTAAFKCITAGLGHRPAVC